MATVQRSPEIGFRYIGWGKTWEVTRIWRDCPPNGTAVIEITNVDDPRNTARLPEKQFNDDSEYRAVGAAVNTEPLVPLTAKEQSMLDLMVDGLTIEELAERLDVKERTAKYYSDRLRFKFGVAKRRDLIRIARERQTDGS